jgi:hypothetical protein
MINDLANRALNAVVRTMGEREPVVYRQRGEAHEVRGVFQAGHVGLDPETGVQVRSTQPVLLISQADLPIKPKQGDEVDVRGVTYLVRDPQPDGHQGVLLMLHRTSNR